jgi:hypothetical protein
MIGHKATIDRDTVAAGGRHAETEEVHAADEVHAEGRQAEGASEGARAHGGGLGGLSGADHQMPAGERPGRSVVGVESGGEAAVAALLGGRREPVRFLYSSPLCNVIYRKLVSAVGLFVQFF